MGSRGPKLVNVTLIVSGKKHLDRVELYNIPEGDAVAFKAKWNRYNKRRGYKGVLQSIDGTPERSFELNKVTEVTVVPC